MLITDSVKPYADNREFSDIDSQIK